ncbi:MAG: nucleotide exchange factor GrpE, partial [Alphaproteobacteria bacterium]|nr:nucleotide exchange factor GrpE [Alphaproteobacteria bacterium]
PGTVAQVFQAGYTLNGRLLREAMVTVAKGAPAAPGATVDTQA